MARDEGHHRTVPVSLLYEAPQCRRDRVAKIPAEFFHDVETWGSGGGFGSKTVGHEEELASGIVSFGFDNLVATRRERLLSVS